MAEPSIKDLAYRTAAGVFGGPVDLATMVMRPFGYKTPDEQVFGSSEYLGKKLEDVGLVSSARAPITEFLTSIAVPTPGGIAKGAALAAPMIGGMFVGKGARTWDALAATKAKMLADIGTDARTIWKETGTWKGPDGKWRQEIDDSAAQIENLSTLTAKDKAALESQRSALLDEVKAQGGKPTDAQKFRMNNINNLASISGSYRGSMGDVLKHEQLYSAYPSKADIPFNWMEMPTGTKGEYAPSTGVALNMGTFGKDAKSTLLHETQHAIQGREGFARGGSPENFNQQDIAKNARDMLGWQREIKARLTDNPSLDWKTAEAMAMKEYESIGFPEAVPSAEIRKMAFNPLEYFESQPEEFVKLYGLDKRTTPYTSNEMYRRLAGEAEARAIQSRMNMTPAQRRALFPEESYDVPINELIIRGVSD